MKDIEIAGKGSVVLLRVERSWLRPHMVTYGGTSRFFARHNTGKYQLDVQEIGQLFAEQRSLGEELRNWRNERVAKLLSDETPASLDGPARLLLHFVPATALVGPQIAGWWPVPNNVRNLLRPSSPSGMSWRYNADGFLVYSVDGSSPCASYVQLFRNGALEYADGYILNAGKNKGAGRETDIPSQSLEGKLVTVFGNGLLAINRIGIQDPIYFSCTLAGVQGLRLSRGGIFDTGVQHTFDRQIVQTPDVQIDRAEPNPYRNSLLPIVDSIWQANGYEETPWLRNWGLDKNRGPISGE